MNIMMLRWRNFCLDVCFFLFLYWFLVLDVGYCCFSFVNLYLFSFGWRDPGAQNRCYERANLLGIKQLKQARVRNRLLGFVIYTVLFSTDMYSNFSVAILTQQITIKRPQRCDVVL